MPTDDDRLAAALIFVTTFGGFVANSFIAVFTGRLSLLRNSFGRLLRLQATGEAIFLAVWAFYFSPVLFFGIEWAKPFSISQWFGRICLICYDISVYSHLIISINRFISLYFPTKYTAIFTVNVTTAIIVGILLLAFALSFVLPMGGCSMVFSDEKWMLDYHMDCNISFVYYGEFLRSVTVVAIIAAINSLTFAKMYLHNRKKANSTSFELSQNAKRRMMERVFIKQTCLQGAAFVMELVCYFLISLFLPQRWPNFLLTTYAWVLLHTLDGVITLTFNKQLRSVIAHPFQQRSKTMVVSSKMVTPTQHASDML